jgi:hypothetical protein
VKDIIINNISPATLLFCHEVCFNPHGILVFRSISYARVKRTLKASNLSSTD